MGVRRDLHGWVNQMYRWTAVILTAAALLATGGCNSRPEGQIVIQSEGTLNLEHEIYWDHTSHEWDVRVDCLVGGSLGHRDLTIAAYDNTFRDGLAIELTIQEFIGSGEYVRTDNQPEPTVQLLLLDDQTDTWRLDSSYGGSCSYSIDSGGREGSYDCQSIPGVVEGTSLDFDDVHLQGSWTCTGLYRDDGERGYGPVIDGDDDIIEF